MVQGQAAQANRIPLTLKLVYTAFVAVLVPVYWYHYTPVNFLYFCDVALLLGVVALWLENGYLASMLALAITLPQLLWQIDFISYAIFSVHFPVDLTNYMFDPQRSLFLRGLSFFHFWLPLLLVWLTWRLGYDRRALLGQIGLSSLVLVLTYLFATDIKDPAENVNKIFGLNGTLPAWMPPLLWLGVLIVVMPVVVYLPTHLVFCWVLPRRKGGEEPHAAS